MQPLGHVASISKVQGRHKQASMAETGDIVANNTHPRNSAPMIDRNTEDNCVVGVGGATTHHVVETSDPRKRPGGSSPGKVRVHLDLKFGSTFFVLRLLMNGRRAQTLSCICECLGWDGRM